MTEQSELVVVGANHRSASLGLRDRLFVDDSETPKFLRRLADDGTGEALVLSTCDRVEIWAFGDDPTALADRAEAALGERRGDIDGEEGRLYVLMGPEAVRHVFSVTASLDSLVIGEPYVPGQVKAAAKLARESGTLGPGLDAVLQAALGAAKRVRTETAIGEGPVSIAASACQLARDLHGDLLARQGLLVGGGDMGELVAESLLAAGLGRLEVTAPRASRAEALARALDAHVVAFEDLDQALVNADIVLAAVGGRQVILRSDTVHLALRRRRRRPVFLIDCAVPGDIEPAVNRLDGAFLYDLADLERLALKGRSDRERAAGAAREIVDAEVTAFLKARSAREAVPAIQALRAHFEDVRQQVLNESKGDAAEATRLFANRLLHAPSEVLKDIAADGREWAELERVLKKLFRLES